MKIIKIILIVLFVLVTLWLGASYYLFKQADTSVHVPQLSKNYDYGVNFTRNFVQNSAGQKIEILTISNQNTDQIIVYFHGNWGRLAYVLQRASAFGTIVSPAYPGYSQSEGSPNSDNVYETVDLTMKYLLDKGYKQEQIVVIGHSLGGSPAVYAATKYPHLKKVVVVNTFYSVQAMCQKDYSILCIFTGDYLNTSKLAPDTVAKIRHFHTPNDELIPFAQGKALFAKFGSKDKKFFEIGGTHGEFPVEEVLTTE